MRGLKWFKNGGREMRRITCAFVLAFVMVAFVGCKKKQTPAPAGVSVPVIEKSDVDAAKAKVNDAADQVKKAATDASKKLQTK
jgi:beta-lactam-binding protein with PASTA domain